MDVVTERDAAWVRGQRLRAQGLALPTDRTPTEAVRRLAAVQSQEAGHAFWSLALRSSATIEEEVRAAYDAGDFVRTHVLRPTWHFVAAEDVRWMLATTAARVHQVNGSAYRSQGLDTTSRDHAAEALDEALVDGAPRTRAELAAILAEAGFPSEGLPLIVLVMHAELEQVLVSGPMRGAAHTYVRLDDRVPSTAADGPDPVLLLRRYLVGHGPATVRDFARWSSLTLTASRAALAELRDELDTLELAGETYVWLPTEQTGDLPPLLLLPLYDELPLAYRDLAHPRPPDHPHPPGTDLFVGSVFAGDTNLGTWRREVKGRTVEVAPNLAPSVPAALRALAETEAARLATFLGRDLELR